ncbi:NifB/NifX family molybdenum-iron cluster-binding protein [Lentisphaerota bacterium WC36G]|nr:NifB/NifX family molybdenum-iron cluster-binding protein [Lentisphaerae bacterium WC36]
MKIVITAKDSYLNNYVDTRFGRANGFLLFDSETKKITFFDNEQNLNATQGAGIQTAQNIINIGADVVLTGHCGPKAFRVLSAAKVKVFTNLSSTTCAKALDDYLNNRLKEAECADVEGHWV